MQRKNNWFSFFYRTRVKVMKGETPIVNLSLLFMLLAVGSAPWLAAGGVIAALALGYRFSVQRDAPEFCGDWKTVAQDATRNVHSAVESVRDRMDGQG